MQKNLRSGNIEKRHSPYSSNSSQRRSLRSAAEVGPDTNRQYSRGLSKRSTFSHETKAMLKKQKDNAARFV